MATNWVLGKVSDALAPTVSGAVSSAGGFAGGAVNAVGNSINGVGEGVNRFVRAYGDGAKDYGNAIMDWTKADGSRGATAANPLGLSSGTTGGKRAVTGPQVYYPPKSTPSKALTTTSKSAAPQKKVGSAPATKSLPTSDSKADGRAAGKKSIKKEAASANAPAGKPSSAPNPGAMRRPAADQKKPVQKTASTATPQKKSISAASKPASAAPKPTAAARPQQAYQGSSKMAQNPLGLSG